MQPNSRPRFYWFLIKTNVVSRKTYPSLDATILSNTLKLHGYQYLPQVSIDSIQLSLIV
jgi:hypothetical protein